jgi:hypothetical protein
VTVHLQPATSGGIPDVTVTRRRRPRRFRLHALVRWLHIYSSLFGLLTILFFGVTGLTLNHPEWFDSGEFEPTSVTGTLDAALLGQAGSEPDSTKIIATLRERHRISGGMKSWYADDAELTLAIAGAGYTADVRIDRSTGQYELQESRLGLIAIINDLHKGRDTGPVWSVVVDVAAILTVFVSLSGVLLLCWLKRRWRSGLITIMTGVAVFMALLAFVI